MNFKNGMGPHGGVGRNCGRGRGRGCGRGFRHRGRGFGGEMQEAVVVSGNGLSSCVERIKARIAYLQARLVRLCGDAGDESTRGGYR